MSLFAKSARLLFLFVGLPVGAWWCYTATRPWFQVDRFIVTVSDHFSASHQQEVISFFQTNTDLKTASLDHVATDVRQHFPAIGKMALSQDASGSVSARVEAVSLYACINQDVVVAGDGRLLKKELFQDALVQSLNTLAIPDLAACCVDGQVTGVKSLAPELLATLSELPQHLFDRFSLSCRRHDAWLLVDKQEPRFAILFHGSHIPNEKVIAMCTKLKGTLDARGALVAQAKTGWVADVRFENQIVLFENAGGSHG